MVFIDTNIFVYAHDDTDVQKSQKARSLLIELVKTQEGRISTQVIQEFCNVVLRKSVIPMKIGDIRKILDEVMLPFLEHKPDAAFYFRALDIYKKYSLSFYDALIVQAAIDMKCSILYSEDLQTGAQYEKVKIINPFV